MNQKVAFLFPGQGSQQLGMLADLSKSFGIVKTVFDEASSVLGYDAWQLAQQGPEQQLNQTEFTQPLLLAADVAVWRCWQEQKAVTPAYMAGHSLGEYAALVCSGALTLADAVKLVACRGRYMQEAVTDGVGGMAAIVGLSDQDVADLCQQAAAGEVVSPANYNSIGQVVVAGNIDAVKRVIELAKKSGAKMAKFIPVSVPSHCALMLPAAERLAAVLKDIPMNAPTIPVLQNVDVRLHQDSQQIKDNLLLQLTHPVRWVETVQWFERQDVTAMVECGPGVVLAKLNKRITRALSTYSINTPESLQATLTAINVGAIS
jgi:[acyl-carrier-protein] S-malonyltransferase